MAPFRDACTASKLPVNVVVLGAASVGKTSVTLQFINEKKVDPGSCQPTIEMSFFKEITLNDFCSGQCDSFSRVDSNKHGVECLWKMDGENSGRKHSSSTLPSLLTKHRHKSSNNNEPETNEFKTVLKVTDTASFKASYNSRKSLRQRLAQRLTPRKRTPVSSTNVPVRKRYRQNFESSPKTMNGVPSFIYRKTDGKSSIHESLMRTADAFILVYSVQDRKSFQVLQQIRSQIHSTRGCTCTDEKESHSPKISVSKAGERRSRLSSSTGGKTKGFCDLEGYHFPPIAIVGTHIDLTAPTVSPCHVDPKLEKTSSDESILHAFTFTPRRHPSRKRILQKQMSIAAEVLLQTSQPRSPEVTSECVRGVVGAWPECVGFAEVSSDNAWRVRRVFEHLTSRVVRNRISGPKNLSLPTYAPRKRMDSAISVFGTRRNSDSKSTTSCWPGKFFCFS